jgi:omega-6 fatty acid desaturase (delta-12 desaturase)
MSSTVLTPPAPPDAGPASFGSALARVKQTKGDLIARYAKPDDLRGLAQILTTLVGLVALWALAVAGAKGPWLLTVLATALMSLFVLRAFSLMHDCGHGSLFRSPRLNRFFGFLMGVISGMPQQVWSEHHHYHHTTNGNWAKYRGPLAILSVDEFDALTPKQQRAYVQARHVRMAPLAGLLYMIVNPRLTWIKGSVALALHVLRGKPAAEFRTPYWESATQYRHMTLNNLVLLGAWVLMAWWLGPALFFTVYLISGGLAGAAGIALFTVQHNFEHSYATDDTGWDYHEAALRGTSFLVLPAWLNWFTVDIGYHHVHHLSARIPNYRLAECHAEFQELFGDVRRLRLADVAPSLKYVLWDQRARRIISVAEYEAAKSLQATRRTSAVSSASAASTQTISGPAGRSSGTDSQRPSA